MPATEYLRPGLVLEEGRDYVFASGVRPDLVGQRYRLVRFVLDVPAYTRKVLVECLTGPDKGLLFVVSRWHFATHYADVPADPAPPDKAAGALEGRGA